MTDSQFDEICALFVEDQTSEFQARQQLKRIKRIAENVEGFWQVQTKTKFDACNFGEMGEDFVYYDTFTSTSDAFARIVSCDDGSTLFIEIFSTDCTVQKTWKFNPGLFDLYDDKFVFKNEDKIVEVLDPDCIEMMINGQENSGDWNELTMWLIQGPCSELSEEDFQYCNRPYATQSWKKISKRGFELGVESLTDD